jgi:hypothetical protein
MGCTHSVQVAERRSDYSKKSPCTTREDDPDLIYVPDEICVCVRELQDNDDDHSLLTFSDCDEDEVLQAKPILWWVNGRKVVSH